MHLTWKYLLLLQVNPLAKPLSIALAAAEVIGNLVDYGKQPWFMLADTNSPSGKYKLGQSY